MSVFSNRVPRTPESSAAYVRAVLELGGGRDAVEVLAETPAALERALAATPAAERGMAEGPGRWSVGEVLRHLADAELVWGYRLRRVLAEERPVLEGYDQDGWAKRFGYAEADAAESLALFVALRRSNLRLIRRADEADLRRTAMHAERGEMDLATLLGLNAGHDLLHLKQIDRIRRAVAGGSS